MNIFFSLKSVKTLWETQVLNGQYWFIIVQLNELNVWALLFYLKVGVKYANRKFCGRNLNTWKLFFSEEGNMFMCLLSYCCFITKYKMSIIILGGPGSEKRILLISALTPSWVENLLIRKGDVLKLAWLQRFLSNSAILMLSKINLKKPQSSLNITIAFWDG